VMKADATFTYSRNLSCSLWYGASSIPAAHPPASPKAKDSHASESFRTHTILSRIKAIITAKTKLHANLTILDVTKMRSFPFLGDALACT
jgi:hypothetical protein